jgi:hypothetical protein
MWNVEISLESQRLFLDVFWPTVAVLSLWLEWRWPSM